MIKIWLHEKEVFCALRALLALKDLQGVNSPTPICLEEIRETQKRLRKALDKRGSSYSGLIEPPEGEIVILDKDFYRIRMELWKDVILKTGDVLKAKAAIELFDEEFKNGEK